MKATKTEGGCWGIANRDGHVLTTVTFSTQERAEFVASNMERQRQRREP